MKTINKDNPFLQQKKTYIVNGNNVGSKKYRIVQYHTITRTSVKLHQNITFLANIQYSVPNQFLLTILLEARTRIRLTQESTAVFHVSISFWSAELEKPSDRSWWLFTTETAWERSEGFPIGCFSSGTYSLSNERSSRGLNASSYIPRLYSVAAIGVCMGTASGGLGFNW